MVIVLTTHVAPECADEFGSDEGGRGEEAEDEGEGFAGQAVDGGAVEVGGCLCVFVVLKVCVCACVVGMV